MALHGYENSSAVICCMAPVKKPPHERAKHYLKEWREYCGLSQEDAADRVGVSRGLLSKIENGKIPYNQDLIERLAHAYGCEVGDLVSRDPNAEPKIPIFDLPKGDADRVYEFIRALRISRDNEAQSTTPVEKPSTRKKQKALSEA